jgi:plastocyanin
MTFARRPDPGRSSRLRGRACLYVVLLVTACSRQPAPKLPPATERPVPAGEGAGNIVIGKGPAGVNGQAPIVVLQPKAATEFPPPAERPYMDQVSQTFVPAMLFTRTGVPTEFRNSDDVLHNVRVRESETREGMFNVAIPTGQVWNFTFPRDGFYDVGCDIHPGMFAQIVSTSSPYATIADTEGNFSIDGVPPGAYKAVVYAGGKKIQKDVQVGAEPFRFDLTQ